MKVCSGFSNPTPIQAQCWPVLASGRDIIGIAETGSGKTLAFSIPALAHLKHRVESEGKSRSGCPKMLIISPTRELAMQSQEVLDVAGASCGVRSVCVYGGVPKWTQKEALKKGVEVVVATPGRLIDLINEGVCDLSQVSYLVLDEADRMLDQGFERDIRAIVGQTHTSRQPAFMVIRARRGGLWQWSSLRVDKFLYLLQQTWLLEGWTSLGLIMSSTFLSHSPSKTMYTGLDEP